ncbi:DUF4303 domain-containing protein [Xanthomonas medicagonis]|uniref:DUF4303 domain-containing protein n=1 Tax=Xanthomonas medicagonis TaxID=3160841 RepID=UPI0035179AE0
MNASPPNQQARSAAIAQAARQAVEALFREHAQDVSYTALIATGEARAPFLSAWSWQALSAETQRQGLDSDEALKGFYADSPYALFGEGCFAEVHRYFAQRPAVDHTLRDAAWAAEFDLRPTAMEDAVRQLDAQGPGAERDRRVVTVEGVPPDRGNTERALRLTPPAALVHWLAKAAEP